MKHKFYTNSDFTEKQINENQILAVAVINGGLQICKSCGLAEPSLTDDCIGITISNRLQGYIKNGKLQIEEDVIILDRELYGVWRSIKEGNNSNLTYDKIMFCMELELLNLMVEEIKVMN